MKVGIRADMVGTELGGSETYVRNIISALGHVDPCGDYTLFLGEPLPAGRLPGSDHLRRVVVGHSTLHVCVPFLPRSSALAEWWIPTGANSLSLALNHIDVMHVQTAAPLLIHPRLVVTLHDISYERFPHFFPPDFVTKLRIRVPLTLRRARAVLTGSEFSKQEIVRRYRVPPDKVVVTPYAADPVFRPIRDETYLASLRMKYGTGDRFILCVGDLQPRKNLTTMIEAYVRLRRADAIRHRLVLVGRQAWLYDDVFAAARESGYADELVFTGYVPTTDLVGLYNAADVLVYPSIFEGFGLPPLEAMACGTPVVTSNTSSLPEVVGDAGVMISPLDAEEMARAVAAILVDRERQAQLAARGIERAEMFSWQNTARIVRDVYQRVAQA